MPSLPETSPILSLPYIQPAQAQKHVTHNEAVQTLDTVVQLTVEETQAVTPPAVPQEGTVFALGASPTGDWAGQGDMLASYSNGAWIYVPPQTGWRAYDKASAALRVWDGTDWIVPEPQLQNLQGVGIGTTSDAVNRLAVSSEATLLNHDGAGHQLKLNKAGVGDTVSLLYQSAWSGRAEMGLAGTDDFSIKVSSDGSNWTTAMTFLADNGRVGIGTTSPVTPLDVVGSGRFTGNVAINGNLTTGLISTETYYSSHPVAAVVDGSAFGTVIHAPANGHLVVALRENDVRDSFSIVSGGGNYGVDQALDSLVATFRADGNIGLGVAEPLRRLHMKDVLRIEPSATPSSPAAGDIYFDSTTNKLRCYDGTSWNDLF